MASAGLKLSVVGLLADQAQNVAADFPNLDIRFIPREREREIPEMTRSSDKVVVMTKFISHSTWHQVPKPKLVPVNGGLTELRGQLALFDKAAELKKAPRPSEKIFVHPSIRNAAKIAAETEMAKKTPAKKPKHLATRAAKAEGSVCDFKPSFMAAKVDDVLTFRRPKGSTPEEFAMRLNAACNYYRSKYGIITSRTIKGDDALLVVDAIVEPGSLPKGARASTLARIVQAEKAKKAKAAAQAALPPPAEAPARQTAPAAFTDVQATPHAATFWADVYARMVSSQPGANDEVLIQRADAALAAYNARFAA